MAWSIWEEGHFHRRPQLVVVGAGITGLFTALFHKRHKPHHHVLVLERGAFPAGASVKNAGFACFGSPSELLADIAEEGEDIALARVEERWKGLLQLRAELGDAAIGFTPNGGHEVYTAHAPRYTQVAEGFDALNEHLKPIVGDQAFHWNDDAIARNGMAGFDHLVRTHLEGGLDSGALMSTLLLKVQSAGVLVRTGTAVTRFNERPGGVELHLSDGSTVEADQVVLATNGYTDELLPTVGIRAARGQVLLTSPIPGLRLRGTFHADEGFYYFRDLDGAVLLGGGRNLDFAGETTAQESTTPVIQDALENMLREQILPNTAFSIAKRWSGIMGFPSKGKEPILARQSERICLAAGLSGMGVAIGIRVARKAALLVDDRNWT
ncbi:MAG: FAD-dependent oxidoreductase [Flavobacteriales bacterium]